MLSIFVSKIMDFLDDLENEGLLKSNVVYVILSPNFPFFGLKDYHYKQKYWG